MSSGCFNPILIHLCTWFLSNQLVRRDRAKTRSNSQKRRRVWLALAILCSNLSTTIRGNRGTIPRLNGRGCLCTESGSRVYPVPGIENKTICRASPTSRARLKTSIQIPSGSLHAFCPVVSISWTRPTPWRLRSTSTCRWVSANRLPPGRDE